ncbi:MAG: IMP dehydrogenase [Acidimicrobiales bacterium]|jgi:guanosine monophosphate reductase|nr:IMP dehydrogenase [Acidimicrobiales bacterium]HJM27712.1 IMP dehydrogenase [Acidimicrobiales bacterium]HJM98466.1 IMP dehydrogenase [Acidimicrobiales bacterium]
MTLGKKSSERLETGLTFDDVLLVPRRSSIRSRQDVSLQTNLTKNILIDLPILAANMDTVCEQEMALALSRLGGVGILHRFMTVEAQSQMVENVKHENAQFIVGAAIGTDHDAIIRSKALIESGVDVLVLDIAHGHAEHAIDALKELKDSFPDTDVIAGNVATQAGAEDLYEAGADAIKVGVGPGGVCTTRLVAGVGVPQLTAILSASTVPVPIIADGGITTSGDMAKAIAAGADTVMIGSMFAGTKESPGEVESSPKGLVKRVRGMASFEAIEARAIRTGELIDDEYFEQRAPEGVEGVVPYKGEVSKLIAQLVAGLKSGMSYSNARTIPEFWEKAEFIRVTSTGVKENKPHATFD